MGDIITPFFPEPIERLNKSQEEISFKSKLFINKDDNLKQHLDLIYSSLDICIKLIFQISVDTERKQIMQNLSIRLFNDVLNALNLLVGGYYQNSVRIQRDILETSWLIDYFESFPDKIEE